MNKVNSMGFFHKKISVHKEQASAPLHVCVLQTRQQADISGQEEIKSSFSDFSRL
jgi:hypothetical protein